MTGLVAEVIKGRNFVESCAGLTRVAESKITPSKVGAPQEIHD